MDTVNKDTCVDVHIVLKVVCEVTDNDLCLGVLLPLQKNITITTSATATTAQLRGYIYIYDPVKKHGSEAVSLV